MNKPSIKVITVRVRTIVRTWAWPGPAANDNAAT
jgi:hypothetical protein